jgi:signal transduction histidine kinase/ActR/RegA family two-component response regulator
MKLQHKAWALVLAIVSLSALAAMLGVRYSVESSFMRLESNRAEQEGERARRLLDQQLTRMSATAKDYAWWADAVEYTEGRNKSFLEDNFDITNLGYLHLSEVLVFDAQAKLLASVTAQADETLGQVAPQRANQLAPFLGAVLADASGMKTVQTYRVADGKLEMLAAAAIRDSTKADDGPHGVILVVRHFDESELTRFSDVLMYPVRLSFDRPFAGSALTHLVDVDDEQRDLYAVVQDANGDRVVDLVIGLDRNLENVGQSLTWKTMAYALGMGVFASMVLVLLLDRLVLHRLQRLHEDVRDIAEKGPMASGQVVVNGRDELSELGDGVNRLLERVRADALAQNAAHQRQEELQLQLMQSQKTEALGRFTSGIAHDFNNSMAAIGGWVRLAEEDTDPQHPSREALQQALKATRYASGLMQQLLTFSRQSPPKLQPLQVGRLIDESRSLVSSGLLRQCELEIDCPPQVVWVTADLTQMQQVLVNLVMNAVDAMGGEGKIRMVVQRFTLPSADLASSWVGATALPAGHYVRISLQDQGTGIPMENISRVFDPFFTTKTVGKGTGLGLSVAQGIMARHDGAIGLTTEQGVGTTFHLYLPETQAPEEVISIAPSVPKLATRQILFADDEPSVRKVWTTLLTRHGWMVTPACDGEEAWTLFQQDTHRWNVVLTDLAMPRLDGRGLTLRIQEAGHGVPIVLMSGHVGSNDALVAGPQRFAAVLQKPVEPEELFRVLVEVCAAAPPSTAGRPDSPQTTTAV